MATRTRKFARAANASGVPAPRSSSHAVLVPLLLVPLSAGAAVDFAHQVVPILKEHCAKCHMDTAKKGGLSMNTRESLLAGSENGAIVEYRVELKLHFEYEGN